MVEEMTIVDIMGAESYERYMNGKAVEGVDFAPVGYKYNAEKGVFVHA